MNRTILLLLLLLSVSYTTLAQTGKLTGEQIVRKMTTAYATAKSYEDVGLVQDIPSGGSTPEPVNSFKTYFVRPGKFRFEWEDVFPAGERNILWSEGKGVFAYWSWAGLEKQESLEMAIAGATGVSRGAAHTVPTLLMKEIGGFRLNELQRLALVREERFEDTDCYVVRGFHPFGFPIDIWIAKSDFLIRRERETNNDGRVEEEIRRSINLNQPIASEVFQYTPPKTKFDAHK